MVVWSDAEVAVFVAVILMVVVKLWTVWHISIKAEASFEGKVIFLGLVSGLTLFGLLAKLYISSVMGL